MNTSLYSSRRNPCLGLTPRTLVLLIYVWVVAVSVCCWSFTRNSWDLGSSTFPLWRNPRVNNALTSLGQSNDLQDKARLGTLGVASKIYVLSLPRRTDRRQEMETLRVTLGLSWSYVDATESQDVVVEKIWNHVRVVRESTASVEHQTPNHTPGRDNSANSAAEFVFKWPDEIGPLSTSVEPLEPSGSDVWLLPSHEPPGPSHTVPRVRGSGLPLTFATKDYVIVPYTQDTPEHKIISPARIACWHSHLAVIRRVANDVGTNDEGVAIVLEDDVDMELDTHDRLESVWSALPKEWDIVFLGHCWSNESYYPALVHSPQDVTYSGTNQSHIHPSRSPKCTHAYALSPTGARRLLLHLTYPPFAYSRAFDQAIAWLVMSGRLKSYSIVPSVVVQRKVGRSDVMQGKGSRWKDELFRGVFGT